MDEFNKKLAREVAESWIKEIIDISPDLKDNEEKLVKIFLDQHPESKDSIEELAIVQESIKRVLHPERYKAEIIKKTIVLPQTGKSISEFASEIGNYFNDKHLLYFRPDERSVVEVEMVPVNKSVDNEEDGKRVLGFHQVKPSEFVTFIENYFNVGVEISRDEEVTFESRSMSKNVAEITLESGQFKEKLPIISKLFTVPIPLLKNGVLVFPKRGYDNELWSWMPYNAPEINADMTLEEAKKLLAEIFKEFCFKGEQDRINAIGALLTPFCRGLYSRETCRSPIFFYKANRERAGKDYCADINGIVYEGMAIADPPIVSGKDTNDEEFRKKILSTLKIGKHRIHSSNNKGFLNSATLEAIATAEFWKDRQLGSNTLLEFPNDIELSLSANTGVTYTPDLSQRSIFINFVLALENPNDRKFDRPNLHEWVREHRSEVLSALYALVKNWYDKGTPDGKVLFASYPEWARAVGGIMESAGYASPCVNNDDQSGLGGDIETADMKKLFELSYENWGEQWISKSKILDEITTDNSDFNDLFRWFTWDKPASARTRFGMLLNKFVNRELSEIVLLSDDNPKSVRRMFKFTKMPEKLDTLATLDTFTTSPIINRNNDDDNKGVVDVSSLSKVSTSNDEKESEKVAKVTKDTASADGICEICGVKGEVFKEIDGITNKPLWMCAKCIEDGEIR